MKRSAPKRDSKPLKRAALKRTHLKRRAAKPRGWKDRDPGYLAWLHQCPCLVCGVRPIQAHHAGPRGLGQKAPDRLAVPLCWHHHARESPASIHSLGPEKFEQLYKIVLVRAAELLYEIYQESVVKDSLTTESTNL